MAIPNGAAKGGWIDKFKAALVVLLLITGCLAAASFVAVHWAEKQILNTDSWVELVSPLPKQPVVSQALGSYIAQQVFDADVVERKITDALPPKADFLAGPLTGQLSSLTTKASQKMVASDGFQSVWTGANRIAMNRLLTTARGQTPDLQSKLSQKFDLDISGSSPQLKTALGKVSEAIPSLQPAASKAVDVTADLKARPHRLRQVVVTMDNLHVVLPLTAVASFAGALALARRRRRLGFYMVGSIFVLMLFELIAVKWLRQTVLDQVRNPSNLSAVGYIYDILVGWLKSMIYVVIGLMVVAWLALYMSGPTSVAESFRSLTGLNKLAKSGAIKRWRKLRLWTGQHEYYLWLGVFLVVLLLLAILATVSGRAVLNAALLLISGFALIHILATPHWKEPKTNKTGKA